MTRENHLCNFFWKRALRLFPALWVCVGLSLFSVFQSGYFDDLDLNIPHLLLWLLSQATAFQFYNPDFMRNYGVGVVNGSLWTISVELQFYLLTPLLVVFLRRNSVWAIGGLVGIFIVLNVCNSAFNDKAIILQKLFNVSFFPWFYMFVLGAIVCKYNVLQKIIIRANIFLLLGLYVFLYFTTKQFGWGNHIHPVAYIVLVCLVFKLAYMSPDLSDKLIKRNDISYGIYIAHMPVVNYVLSKGYVSWPGIVISLLVTLVLAMVSWFLIEKRALSLKPNPLR